ncbi:hypothetical protein D3C79_903650 [compost metagenome]
MIDVGDLHEDASIQRGNELGQERSIRGGLQLAQLQVVEWTGVVVFVGVVVELLELEAEVGSSLGPAARVCADDRADHGFPCLEN